MSNEWRPIAEYDAMKKKPDYAAFLFEATKPTRFQGHFLSETVQLTRNYGCRACVLWYEIPSPKKGATP